MRKFNILTLLLLLFWMGGLAQKNFFQSVGSNQLPLARQATTQITKKGVYKLDEKAMRIYLLPAPLEFKNNGKTLPLEIPLPNGEIETFNIVESPILSPQVAAANPSIKTYTGNGTRDKKSVIRINLTSNGFSAIILNVGGDAVYFEHYSEQDSNVYINYFAKDAALQPGQKLSGRCGVNETQTNKKSSLKQGGSGEKNSGGILRTFRIAVAADAEFTAVHGGTQASSFATVVNYVNNMTALYRNELSVSFVLVSGTNVIYTNAATDPYDNSNQTAMLSQNQSNLDAVIGNANYDIGHVWGFEGSSGGGIASLEAVCDASIKGKGVSGEGEAPYAQVFNDQLFFHEVGHQFGMTHSYNSSIPVCTTRNPATSVEPGSGATIMSYGFTCDNDDYFSSTTTGPILNFHTVNYDQAEAYMANPGAGFGNCFVGTATGNSPPVVIVPANYTIPKSTPFALTGSATDANGDALTYSWEGTNIGTMVPDASTLANTAEPPFFRTYAPVTSPTRTYPLLSAILDGSNYAKGDKLPSVSIATTHRLTVRDNNPAGGGVNYGSVTVTVDGNIGPFLETKNLSGTYAGNSSQTITWSVNGTDAATPNIKISLSTDGGLTFPIVLLASTPNDGTQSVTLPNITTSTARIKVEAVGNIFFDISNADFSINATALPNLSINDIALNEGNSGTTSFTFTVSLSTPAPAGGVTFDIATANGTAVAPGDFTAKSLTAQTIPAGSSTYSFTVLVNGDVAVEPNETFFVNVANATGAVVTDAQGQGTITNDDAALPNLSINDIALNEGNSGTTSFTFTVSLSTPAPAGGVTFDIATANGTAIAPGDFTAKSLTAQTIPAGSSTYSFTVLVNGDVAVEPNETFFVNVANATGAVVTDAQGQGTITNDDVALPNLSINDIALNEGNSGTTSFTFTVSLSTPAPAGGVTFDIATANGTAIAPGDFTAKSLTAQTIPAGSSTYSFTVLVNGDVAVEPNETFFVNVANATGAVVTDAQGQGTITNDDVALPNLSINDIALNEGNSGTTSFTFTVSLSTPAPAGGVTFDIATANGTAIAPGDFTAKSLTAQTIPAGSSTYSFTVLVNGDVAVEPNETFFVNVANATGAVVTDAQGQGTITNDDAAPLPNLTITDVTQVEGNSGTSAFTFTVNLSAPAPAGGVTFDIATANGTAIAPGDFTAKSLTAQTIPAGSSTYSFTVLVNGDVAVEPNETFFVNVANATGAVVTDAQGQGTITNDDVALPNLSINDIALNEGNSGTTSFTFTVSLSTPAPAGGVTFDIATANGTAIAPGDFTAKSLTAQAIPAGSSTYSFTILVNGDVAVEPNETFFVNVANATGAVVTDAQGQGTITNDDAAPLPNLTITDVTQVEGNSGTSAFTFTVNLSAPAPAGGVTFNVATANGTATAGSDYVALNTTRSIAAGSSSTTVAVTVNGDVTLEGNETFTVNISNATNAVITDGQGLGTITNDEVDPCAGDQTPPTITSKNITINLDASGHATIQPGDVIQSVTDNCAVDNSSFQVNPSTFSCADLTSSSTSHLAYTANTSVGTQAWGGELGMEFTVNTPGGIVIKQLGAFDHQGNGIMGSVNGGVRVAIFNKATKTIVTGLDVTITGFADGYVGNHRMKNITPVTLMPGNYVVVAKGYNAGELNGNFSLNSPVTAGDNGGGGITYTGRGLYGTNNGFNYPENPDRGPAYSYQAGTFLFENAVTSTSTPHLAYTASTSTGTQAWEGELGMEFTVNTPGGIVIKQLGAFDHQGNGINGSINGGVRVAIFNKATKTIVTGLDVNITGLADGYVGNHRMKNITPVTLMPGNYVVVAKGYNAGELNGNFSLNSPVTAGDNGGGAITYTGSGLYGTSSGFNYPAYSDGGPANNYQAGTFLFETATANTSVPHLAYTASTTIGTQAWDGELGMEFTVNAPDGIVIKQLGAFDHQGNGITGSVNGGVRVAIFNKATKTIVTGLDVTITGLAEAYVGDHRMKNITPVTLAPGNYAVVAKGYNANEKNGNFGTGSPITSGDNGGGAITYTGSGLYGNTNTNTFTYPINQDEGPANRYHAGTFSFSDPVNNGKTVTITVKDVSGNIATATSTVLIKDPNGACNGGAVAKLSPTIVPIASPAQNAKDLMLYPNPSTGAFSLQLFNVKPAKISVQIFSKNGRLVQQKEVNLIGYTPSIIVKLNIFNQPSGMYLVKVINGDVVQLVKAVLLH